MKRFIILWTLFVFSFIPLLSQNRQVSPVFPGGVVQLKAQLTKTIRKEFRDYQEHPSTIRINFSVTKKGRPFNGTAPQIKDVKVQRKIAKAIRKLPRFTPGTADGQAIVSDVSIEIEL